MGLSHTRLRAQPLVSVVVPTYNGGRFIARAIRSVLAQTLTDFELLVVDDASTDDTLTLVADMRDERIRILQSPVNAGAGVNWNRAVGAASGRYVKLLCQDDLLEPRCLERQVAAFGEEGQRHVALVSARRYIIDEKGRILAERGLRRTWGGDLDGARAKRLVCRAGGNLIGEPSAVLFRRDDALRVGLFDETAEYVIDVDLWFRLLTLGALHVVDEPCAAFRVSSSSWSVVLARRQAEQFYALVRRTAERDRAGLTQTDVLLGCSAAYLMMTARRLLYLRLRLWPGDGRASAGSRE